MTTDVYCSHCNKSFGKAENKVFFKEKVYHLHCLSEKVATAMKAKYPNHDWVDDEGDVTHDGKM